MDHSPFEIWDFQITRWNNKDLIKWGVKENDEKGLQYFSNSTLMIIREKGNNSILVRIRAKKRAEFNLKVLQAYLSESLSLHDEHLLLELSEYSLLKNLDTESIGYGGSPKRKSYRLHLHQELEGILSKTNYHYDIFKKLSPPLRRAIQRTLFWIGKSIEEPEHDQKILALCTALETLLTTIADQRKGEAIAYRMIILNSIHEKRFADPSRVLMIYKLRSDIIHGSDLFITTRSEYLTMRRVARETLSNFIELAEKAELTTIHKMIQYLESSEICNSIIEWLNQRKDQNSIAIKEALEKR